MSTASPSASAPPRRSSSRSAPRSRPATSTRPRCAAATSRPGCAKVDRPQPRGDPRGDRRVGPPDHRHHRARPLADAAGAGAGPHPAGHPPRRRWRDAAGHGPADLQGDRPARAPRRRPPRVRGARRRSVPGELRPAQGDVHGPARGRSSWSSLAAAPGYPGRGRASVAAPRALVIASASLGLRSRSARSASAAPRSLRNRRRRRARRCAPAGTTRAAATRGADVSSCRAGLRRLVWSASPGLRGRVLQGGGDRFAFEGGEGEDGAAADGGLVGAGGEDRREAGGVAEGAEGGDGGLPGEGVGVIPGDPGEGAGGARAGDRAELAQGPRRGLGDGHVVVGEAGHERAGRGGADRGRELGGAATHGRIRVGHGSPPGGARRAGAGAADERTQRRGPHPGVGVGAGPLPELPHGAPREASPHAEAGGMRSSFEGGVRHGTATLRPRGPHGTLGPPMTDVQERRAPVAHAPARVPTAPAAGSAGRLDRRRGGGPHRRDRHARPPSLRPDLAGTGDRRRRLGHDRRRADVRARRRGPVPDGAGVDVATEPLADGVGMARRRHRDRRRAGRARRQDACRGRAAQPTRDGELADGGEDRRARAPRVHGDRDGDRCRGRRDHTGQPGGRNAAHRRRDHRGRRARRSRSATSSVPRSGRTRPVSP